MNFKKLEVYLKKMRKYSPKRKKITETIARLGAKLAEKEDMSINDIHRLLNNLIKIKDNPKPISIKTEKIEAIKSKIKGAPKKPIQIADKKLIHQQKILFYSYMLQSSLQFLLSLFYLSTKNNVKAL